MENAVGRAVESALHVEMILTMKSSHRSGSPDSLKSSFIHRGIVTNLSPSSDEVVFLLYIRNPRLNRSVLSLGLQCRYF
jgi:hypothetical protein